MIDGTILNQEVTITSKDVEGKYDSYGQPIAGTPTPAAARVQEVQTRIQKDPNTYIDIRLEVWLKPEAEIENNDIVTWEDEEYYVERVEKKRDLWGAVDHIKVLCR